MSEMKRVPSIGSRFTVREGGAGEPRDPARVGPRTRVLPQLSR